MSRSSAHVDTITMNPCDVDADAPPHGQSSSRRTTRLPKADETTHARLAQIERERRTLGCTQAALAQALGVSRSTVARLLRGELQRSRVLPPEEGLGRIEEVLAQLARTGSLDVPTATISPALQVGAQPASTQESEAMGMPDRRPRRATATAVRTARRILIAEDDSATVSLYRMVLAEEHELDYHLVVAQTPVACVEALTFARPRTPFDLLLMDLGLADMRLGDIDSSLLARFLRSPELLPPRLLVVSGVSPYHLRRRHDQLAALGAAFMAKPFDVDDLLAGVRSLCLRALQPANCLTFFTEAR